jgi:hypothetical protein
LQGFAQKDLGRSPLERRTLARYFLQRLTKGSNRLFELRRPALTLPEGLQGIAQAG